MSNAETLFKIIVGVYYFIIEIVSSDALLFISSLIILLISDVFTNIYGYSIIQYIKGHWKKFHDYVLPGTMFGKAVYIR